MSKATNRQSQNRNTKVLMDFCREYGFEFKELNQGFQYRIEGVLDVYPVRGRYHALTTQERGSWHTAQDLRRVLLEAIPTQNIGHLKPEQIMPPFEDLRQKGAGYYVVGQQPQVMNVLSIPVPKREWPRVFWERLKYRFRRTK
jgi:hypothetical protein